MRPKARTRGAATDIDGFHRLAQQYVRIIANHDRYPIRRLLLRLDTLVPGLYALGIQLPSPVVEPARHPERLTPREWQRVFRSLRRRLGHRDRYRQVFDEYDRKDSGVVIGSLAGDLADIYSDLLDGLRYWRIGERDEAVWTWRFGVDYHWGEHATSAMRAMYWLRRDYEFGPPGAMPNNALQQTHTRVTARARTHGPRHAARR